VTPDSLRLRGESLAQDVTLSFWKVAHRSDDVACRGARSCALRSVHLEIGKVIGTMPTITFKLGDEIKSIEVPAGTIIGDAVADAGMPLEQQCAGKGTCGKCRVVVLSGVTPLNEIELEKLSSEQIAAGHRLGCQARVAEDCEVTLFPPWSTPTRYSG